MVSVLMYPTTLRGRCTPNTRTTYLISLCVLAVNGRDKVICVNKMEANEIANKVSNLLIWPAPCAQHPSHGHRLMPFLSRYNSSSTPPEQSSNTSRTYKYKLVPEQRAHEASGRDCMCQRTARTRSRVYYARWKGAFDAGSVCREGDKRLLFMASRPFRSRSADTRSPHPVSSEVRIIAHLTGLWDLHSRSFAISVGH